MQYNVFYDESLNSLHIMGEGMSSNGQDEKKKEYERTAKSMENHNRKMIYRSFFSVKF